jgi:hypothetical protein
MGDAFLYALDTDSQMSQKLIDLWRKIALTLARAYGELKFDAVVLADSDLASLSPVHYPKIQPVLKTLRNLINFYDAPLIILTKRVPPVPQDRLSAFLKLEADGFSLGNPISDLGNLFSSTGKLFGGCIPRSALLGPVEGVEKVTLELLDKGSKGSFFVASEWEVSQTTPALNMHKIMQVLAAAPAK